MLEAHDDGRPFFWPPPVMNSSATPTQRLQSLRDTAPAQPLLRSDIRTATRHDLTPSQAQALLLQALDELRLVATEEADHAHAERLHECFVQILHTAQALHPTVETAVLQHMVHSLREHHAQHDRVAHALVSAWTAVGPHDPTTLVVGLIDALASNEAPLPFWLSHVLQLLPAGHSHPLLQARLNELTPAGMAHRVRKLEHNPDLPALEHLIGDLGVLALEQSPTAGLSRWVEVPPGDDESVVWLSHQHHHQHPGLVCVGDRCCDDHWLLTPLGHSTLEHLLHLCAQQTGGVSRRLRQRLLYQFTHAARLALIKPERRHPCLVLAHIHRIAQTFDKGDDVWTDVLDWLAPQRSGHHSHPASRAAQHQVLDLLLLPSFEATPRLALRTLVDAQVEPTAWLPAVVRCCMATQPGLSRLLRPLQHLHANSHLNHALVREVLHQCAPAHLLRVGFEIALTVFHEPARHQGLTTNALHALARAQSRFGSGWVPFSLLAHLLDEGRRFGCVGLGVTDGEWLLTFAQENAHKLPAGLPPLALKATLIHLFDVLTRLGLEPDPVAHVCMQLFDHWAAHGHMDHHAAEHARH